ncbi:MAG: hypothetical protein N2578_06865, partial [Bdellovibrionaceae bacterium]|nr:hypothetical protein [Pseudobdellovibrionaceae bacterium]
RQMCIRDSYDTEAGLDEISPEVMRAIDLLHPFGPGNESPLFLFRGLGLESIRELRGGHRKIKFFGSSVEGLLFFPSPRLLSELGDSGGGRIDIIAELQCNWFAGERKFQLVIQDIQRSG